MSPTPKPTMYEQAMAKVIARLQTGGYDAGDVKVRVDTFGGATTRAEKFTALKGALEFLASKAKVPVDLTKVSDWPKKDPDDSADAETDAAKKRSNQALLAALAKTVDTVLAMSNGGTPAPVPTPAPAPIALSAAERTRLQDELIAMRDQLAKKRRLIRAGIDLNWADGWIRSDDPKLRGDALRDWHSRFSAEVARLFPAPAPRPIPPPAPIPAPVPAPTGGTPLPAIVLPIPPPAAPAPVVPPPAPRRTWKEFFFGTTRESFVRGLISLAGGSVLIIAAIVGIGFIGEDEAAEKTVDEGTTGTAPADTEPSIEEEVQRRVEALQQ